MSGPNRYRERAQRALRRLEKERSTHGFINDGAGMRYRIAVYFLLAGDLEKAAEAVDWFYSNFPEDVGEPVFDLYAALVAYRCSEVDVARGRLLQAMLANLFLLPRLFGRHFDVPGLWYPTNWHQESYLLQAEEFLQEPTPEERGWMEREWDSPLFTTLRDGCIHTFTALNGERDTRRRVALLRQWDALLASNGVKAP